MKLRYYPETRSLYIELRSGVSAEAGEISEGVVADYDADGNIIGLEMEDTSNFDLTKLETSGLPQAVIAKTA